ncbi:hypothetical protein ACFO9E_00235 [Streptomyces maoxianensis]|uniref:Uncharacterized protein n=1 Tax=Streptomyces maoxianensis TaxID=1459942 RepID=A0ABV9FZ30_9ACTN
MEHLGSVGCRTVRSPHPGDEWGTDTAAHDAAARAALAGGELEGMRIQLIADAAAALLVLLTAAALSVFKPRGVTRYGRRRQRDQSVLPH